MPHGPGRAEHWRELGAKVVDQQLDRQVRSDGAHFEQATYYHVYALDMFVFHGILVGETRNAYREKVALMADYLAAVQGPSRDLPFIGDDDGGRFFHPFGPRDTFGRATVATCAVWLSRSWTYTREDLFPQAAWWLGRRPTWRPSRPLGTTRRSDRRPTSTRSEPSSTSC